MIGESAGVWTPHFKRLNAVENGGTSPYRKNL